MQNKNFQIVLLAFLVGIGLARAAAHADQGCCAQCGCAAPCQQVCRLVREEKLVETYCWGCASEDFCVPGPSKPACRHCETVCGACEAGECTVASGTPKPFVWTEWMPGCARIFTRKKLMKKTVLVKVPCYKWVIEDLCPACDAKCSGAELQPGEQMPPPPVATAKLKYGLSTKELPPRR
jgi:hypothetical protein